MQPEILSDIIEHTVHEGKSAGAIAFRQHHPVHKILTDEFIDLVETENKQASFVNSVDNSTTRQMFQRFSQLPLSKKLALIASLGGSAGGLAGAIAPGKGGLGIGSRMLNGAFRGATLGAGSVLGSQVGKEVGALSNTGTPAFGPRSEHALAQLAGGAAGLVGTHKLLGKIGPLNA
jgi:hypothetical protein